MNISRWSGLFFAIFAMATKPLWAQTSLPGIPVDSGGISQQVFGAGQFSNLNELMSFGQDTVLTLFLTALIVFHPVRRRSRHVLIDLQMPRLFFLYALVGLIVGFLVIQHGYIIGFVIFGIGTLMRFRSSLDDPLDTSEVILVTLIGLTIGLGLSVMAILFGMIGWGKIWLAGRKRGYEVILRSTKSVSLQECEQAVKKLIDQHSWEFVNSFRQPAKNSCRILLFAPGKLPATDVQEAVAQSVPEGVETQLRF